MFTFRKLPLLSPLGVVERLGIDLRSLRLVVVLIADAAEVERSFIEADRIDRAAVVDELGSPDVPSIPIIEQLDDLDRGRANTYPK